MPTTRVRHRRTSKIGENTDILGRILAGERPPWPGEAIRNVVALAEFFDPRVAKPEDVALVLATLGRWLDEEIEIAVAEHVALHPGSRPAIWWNHKAPEPRRRVGGIGALWGDVYGRGGYPRYRNGLPDETWITLEMRERDIEMGMRFRGAPVDPRNPPSFESEAAFLERHNLFRPGERARIVAADFAPERIALR